MSQAIATLRDGSAASKKGKKRVDQILEAAAAILVDGGAERFSMNRVAAETGISLGNLQYYFPKRKDLIWALLETEITEIQHAIADQISESQGKVDDVKLLLNTVDYVLDMNQVPRNCAIAWNAWTMSQYDPGIQDILDRWYTMGFEIFDALVANANPKLTKRRREHVTRFIIFAIEGESVAVRSLAGTENEYAAMKRDFRRAVLKLIES